MARNYYEVLQVDADAEPEQIESAYRVRVLHLQGRHDGVSAEELKMVHWAHKMLSDPEKRAQYDLKVKRESVEQSLDEKRTTLAVGGATRNYVVGGVIGLIVLLVLILALR